MSQALLLSGLACIALVGAVVWIYNRLVFNRQRVAEAWSGVQVQLKRRSSLVPNLVECVRGYTEHEQAVLQVVTLQRTAAEALSEGSPRLRQGAELALSAGLQQLLVRVEAYPDLKADQQFLTLQQNLSECEEQLQMARRYYNGAVRELNILVESVPSNFLARLFGFQSEDYFALERREEAQAPQVTL